MIAWALAVKLLSCECCIIFNEKSASVFGLWIGAVREQATNWASVDPGQCHYMTSLGYNELNYDSSGHHGIFTNQNIC